MQMRNSESLQKWLTPRYNDLAREQAGDINKPLLNSGAIDSPNVGEASKDRKPAYSEITPLKDPIFRTSAIDKINDHKIRVKKSKRLPIIVSTPITDTRSGVSGIENHVKELTENLKSTSPATVREATFELRLLAKDANNRILMASSEAITTLVNLLFSTDLTTQENAVTTLLNLSISDNNKLVIANANAIDPLIHVLQTGNPEARANSAATLSSLSKFQENKTRIGKSGAIGPLVDLLRDGTPQGKKDAINALLYLSTTTENMVSIVKAGGVQHLIDLMDPANGMLDRATVVVANISSIPEGRNAIAQAGGIALLVEEIELGSPKGKENAVAALSHFCSDSNKYCRKVLEEGAGPPLVSLSMLGTPRAKEKALKTLCHLRNLQRVYGKRG